MPFLIPVALAIGAALAVSVEIAAIGGSIAAFIGAGVVSASVVAGAIGTIVSVGSSMLIGALTKPKSKATSAGASASALAEDRSINVRQSISPRRILYGQQMSGGSIIYESSAGADKRYLHLVVVLNGHPVDGIGNVYLNDTGIPVSSLPSPDGDGVVRGYAAGFDGKLYMEKYLGNQTAACAALVAGSEDGWSADHVGYGQAYLYLRLEYSNDLFGTGISSIKAVVTGKQLYDPRSGTTYFSRNPAMVLLDYLRTYVTNSAGAGIPDSAIDWASFQAAANICDEAVWTSAGGATTQLRYECDLTLFRDADHRANIAKILSSCAGVLTYIQGKYQLYAGAYDSPTDSLTVDDLAGPIRLTTKAALRAGFNAVKGTFLDPGQLYAAQEFPAQTSSTFEAEDGGGRVYRDLTLEATIDATRAQRLARIELLRGRDQLRFEAPLRLAGLRFGIWQPVAVTLAELGWSSKVFRLERFRFSPQTGEVVGTFRVDNASSYAWLYDLATALGATPATSLVNPLLVPAPTGLGVTASTAIAPDGTVVPALTVTWTGSANAFVSAHEVQWQIDSGPWQSAEVPSGVSLFQIRPVLLGSAYTVRVRGVAGLVRGAWSSTGTGAGAPDTTPPGAPTAGTVFGTPRGFTVSWVSPSDPDLDRMEIWANGTGGSVGSLVGVSSGHSWQYTGATPGQTLYFWLRPVDRSGNRGSYTAVGSATVPRLVTDDLTAGAMSGYVAATAYVSATLDKPGSGEVHYGLVSATLDVQGTADVLISFGLPGKTWRYPSLPATGGGTSGSSDGGDAGGGGGV